MATAWWPVEWVSPGGSGADWNWKDSVQWEQFSDHSTSDGGTYLGGEYSEEEGLIWKMQEEDWEELPEEDQALFADEAEQTHATNGA